MNNILFTDIAELVTNEGVVQKHGIGITQEDLGIIHNAALAWNAKKGILWLGKKEDTPRDFKKNFKKISLKDKILTPTLVDCHTHLVFSGSRHGELSLRLQGKSYQEIAAAGGGIRSSVKATRLASEKDLYALAYDRITHSMKLGVGIFEIKSGYGLDWPTEKKMLTVIKKLKREFSEKAIIQSTFLGAHAFPPGTSTEQEREQYVDEIINQMLPRVIKEKLADACDVFCDEGYFTIDQSRRILKKAQALGLKIKLHADELKDTGSAALAAELHALSADHLLKASQDGLIKMAQTGVVAVLLPGTAFYLGLPYASIENMRKAGVCMALSTDFNPGSSPILHLPFIMSLACMQIGMSMPEAFAAATYGGARALGYHAQHGSLQIGTKPKMAIFRCPSYEALISQVAHPGLCEQIL